MTHPNDALRLVPVEPTEAMLWRGFDARGAMTGLRHVHLVYRAMLSAAPASPLPEGGGQCSGISGELKSPDLDALEKLADEATPGPWNYEGVGYTDNGGQYREVTSAAEVIFGEWGVASEENASFIAAANPATIKALIAELKEARKLLTRIDRLYADMQDGNGNHPTELRRVRAFLAKAQGGE